MKYLLLLIMSLIVNFFALDVFAQEGKFYWCKKDDGYQCCSKSCNEGIKGCSAVVDDQKCPNVYYSTHSKIYYNPNDLSKKATGGKLTEFKQFEFDKEQKELNNEEKKSIEYLLNYSLSLGDTPEGQEFKKEIYSKVKKWLYVNYLKSPPNNIKDPGPIDMMVMIENNLYNEPHSEIMLPDNLKKMGLYLDILRNNIISTNVLKQECGIVGTQRDCIDETVDVLSKEVSKCSNRKKEEDGSGWVRKREANGKTCKTALSLDPFDDFRAKNILETAEINTVMNEGRQETLQKSVNVDENNNKFSNPALWYISTADSVINKSLEKTIVNKILFKILNDPKFGELTNDKMKTMIDSEIKLAVTDEDTKKPHREINTYLNTLESDGQTTKDWLTTRIMNKVYKGHLDFPKNEEGKKLINYQELFSKFCSRLVAHGYDPKPKVAFQSDYSEHGSQGIGITAGTKKYDSTASKTQLDANNAALVKALKDVGEQGGSLILQTKSIVPTFWGDGNGSSVLHNIDCNNVASDANSVLIEAAKKDVIDGIDEHNRRSVKQYEDVLTNIAKNPNINDADDIICRDFSIFKDYATLFLKPFGELVYQNVESSAEVMSDYNQSATYMCSALNCLKLNKWKWDNVKQPLVYGSYAFAGGLTLLSGGATVPLLAGSIMGVAVGTYHATEAQAAVKKHNQTINDYIASGANPELQEYFKELEEAERKKAQEEIFNAVTAYGAEILAAPSLAMQLIVETKALSAFNNLRKNTAWKPNSKDITAEMKALRTKNGSHSEIVSSGDNNLKTTKDAAKGNFVQADQIIKSGEDKIDDFFKEIDNYSTDELLNSFIGRIKTVEELEYFKLKIKEKSDFLKNTSPPLIDDEKILSRKVLLLNSKLNELDNQISIFKNWDVLFFENAKLSEKKFMDFFLSGNSEKLGKIIAEDIRLASSENEIMQYLENIEKLIVKYSVKNGIPSTSFRSKNEEYYKFTAKALFNNKNIKINANRDFSIEGFARNSWQPELTIEIINSPVKADGFNFDPSSFYLHDLIHFNASFKHQYLDIFYDLSKSNVDSRKKLQVLAKIDTKEIPPRTVEEIEKIISDRKKFLDGFYNQIEKDDKSVEAFSKIWFTLTHEATSLNNAANPWTYRYYQGLDNEKSVSSFFNHIMSRSVEGDYGVSTLTKRDYEEVFEKFLKYVKDNEKLIP